MVAISENAVWTPVTRIEPTTVALGGDENNSPNLQLKQLVDRTKYLYDSAFEKLTEVKTDETLTGDGTTANPLSVVPPVLPEKATIEETVEGTNDTKFVTPLGLSSAMYEPPDPINPEKLIVEATSEYEVLEGTELIIDLATIFDNSQVYFYQVVSNSAIAKLDSIVYGSKLFVKAKMQFATTGLQDVVTVVIRAEGSNRGYTDHSIEVTINLLETLFTEPFWAFDVDDTVLSVQSNLYVGTAERASINGNPAYSGIITDLNTNVFDAIISTANILPEALALRILTPVIRFQNLALSYPAYVYSPEAEANTIIGVYPDFDNEGVAFYAFTKGVSRGVPLHRHQKNSGSGAYTYVYQVGTLASVPGYRYEGIVCRVMLPTP